MRFSTLALFLLLFVPITVWGQQAATWQQEVAYEMDFTLHADRNQFDGTQRLTYTNNSPDTLAKAYFHLYFNAFNPNSLMAERNRHLPDPDNRVIPKLFNLTEDEIGYINVQELSVDGRAVEWTIHDTVMEVHLNSPILPGQSVVFDMVFDGQVPLQTRRSGRDSDEGVRFSMSQWYPKIAAYDAIGWHAHPYIGREFYAPFGSFDVRLTLPSDYVVGATGTLQNPEEIGHGYQYPADAGVVPMGAAPNADGVVPDSLTWHFFADKVHDFAWGADPDYIHERTVVTGVHGREDDPVHIHLLYKPEVADRWTEMAGWMIDMTHFFSERYGTYPYPQFTVIQGGDGGMEYPMLTLITGNRNRESLFGVTAHEFAHMWFYGIVATNESLHSWIDEGITNYATQEAMHHVLGGSEEPADHTRSMAAVVRFQQSGRFERMTTHADWFDTSAGFSVASYTAGQAFIDLLGYVMGDGVRDSFLYRLGTEWRFRHPYPADILQTAQKESGMHLYWLFDQFLNGPEQYDYAVSNITSEQNAEGYTSRIILERHASGILPIDLLIRFADGSAQWVHIPVDVSYGHKPVPANWMVATAWPWVSPVYQLEVESNAAIVEAGIDPSRRTPDRDRNNNQSAP